MYEQAPVIIMTIYLTSPAQLQKLPPLSKGSGSNIRENKSLVIALSIS